LEYFVMNRITTNLMKIISLLTVSVIALAACGGGGGSSSGGGGGGLGNGTFTKTVEGTNDINWNVHFDSGGFSFVHTQQMYQADEVDGSGYINSLSFKYFYTVDTDVTCDNVTIKLGHTSRDNATGVLSDLTMNADIGSLVTVLDDATITIPAGAAGDYFKIPFTDKFNYDGVSNLLVDFSRASNCTANVRPTAETGFSTGKFAYSISSGNPDGGTLSSDLIHIKFDFVGGDNHVALGADDFNSFPFAPQTPRVQHLYLASEINGSGPVTGLAFQMNGASTATTYTMTISMGHTTLSTLGDTFANNFDAGSPVTVANTVTINIPAGLSAGDWFWVPLPANTFTYNGTDNLIIDYVTTAASVDNFLRTKVLANRRLFNTDNTAATGVFTSSEVPDIKLRFNGGTIDTGIGGIASTSALESDADGADVQNLNLASELGTGGTITSISLRLDNDSNAATHMNYTIKMGHTAKTDLILADTFASNMNENATVFNGVLDIPAGLLAGDWITIPVSFNYDSTKNLAILFSTAGNAGAINDVRWLDDIGRYPARLGLADVGGSTNPTFIDTGILEMRLGISK
jgi:hypothetical protein